MLGLATLLALYFHHKNKDRIYPLVFVWACIGIGVINAASHQTISITSYALSAVFLITIKIMLEKHRDGSGVS